MCLTSIENLTRVAYFHLHFSSFHELQAFTKLLMIKLFDFDIWDTHNEHSSPGQKSRTKEAFTNSGIGLNSRLRLVLFTQWVRNNKRKKIIR